MLIPLANAIFDDNIEIKNFIKPKLKSTKKIFFNNLNFKKVDKNKFPLINLKTRVYEHYSTPIIINAANEILVDQYLKKKIPFHSFYKFILGVLRDRNYRKYAIREPRNIDQIFLIDQWSRLTTYEKIKNDI